MLELIINIIFLILSFAGMIIGMYYLCKQIRIQSNILLNLLLILLSLDLFIVMYVNLDLWAIFPQLLFINWAFPFVYGPLIYLYYLMVFNPDLKLKWFHLFYFSPFVFMLILNFPTIFQVTVEKSQIYKEFRLNNIPYLANDMEWIGHTIYNTVFILLSYTVSKLYLTKMGEILKRFAGILLVLFFVQLIYLIIYNIFEIYFELNNWFVILLWMVICLLYFFTRKYTGISPENNIFNG